MGYTHNYGFNKRIEWIDEYPLKLISKVCSNYGKIIKVEKLDETGFVINGIGQNGFETFSLDMISEAYDGKFRRESEFCKTALKPYDIPVCEILLILKAYYGDDFYLFSDGIYGEVNNICLFEQCLTDGNISGIEQNWITAYKEFKQLIDQEFC